MYVSLALFTVYKFTNNSTVILKEKHVYRIIEHLNVFIVWSQLSSASGFVPDLVFGDNGTLHDLSFWLCEKHTHVVNEVDVYSMHVSHNVGNWIVIHFMTFHWPLNFVGIHAVWNYTHAVKCYYFKVTFIGCVSTLSSWNIIPCLGNSFQLSLKRVL